MFSLTLKTFRVPKVIEDSFKSVLVRSPFGNVKYMANRCNSLQDCINLAFSPTKIFPFPWVSICPAQVREEIAELLKFLVKRKVRWILEIGTARGGTLFLFTRVSSSEATIISLDLPHGPFGGGYPEWKIPLYKSFALFKQKIYLICGDSHRLATLHKVEDILGEFKLDFLFIDGDHRYEGVKKDFEMYSILVRPGGIVAFHDIVPGPSEAVGGVPRFWSEIKQSYNHVEIVKNWKQGGYGIGVIFV